MRKQALHTSVVYFCVLRFYSSNIKVSSCSLEFSSAQKYLKRCIRNKNDVSDMDWKTTSTHHTLPELSSPFLILTH